MLSWIKSHKVWTGVIVFFGLAALGSVLPDVEETGTSTTTTTVPVPTTEPVTVPTVPEYVPPTTPTTVYVDPDPVTPYNGLTCSDLLGGMAAAQENYREATTGLIHRDGKAQRAMESYQRHASAYAAYC